MDPVDYQHKELAAGRWAQMPCHLQMGNIGSEVSRAVKWKDKGNEKRMTAAAYRALELFELSISACLSFPTSTQTGRLKELCRGKEEFADYIFGNNEFHTDPLKMTRYYDQFVTLTIRPET